MIQYGQTLAFGSSTYTTNGYKTSEEALWAAFRGMAGSCVRGNVLSHVARKAMRRYLSKEQVQNLDRIAANKLFA